MILTLFIFNINLFPLERWTVICKIDLWIYEKLIFLSIRLFFDKAWYYLFSRCLYLLNRTHQLPAMPQLNCFYNTSVFSPCYLISLVSIFMTFTSRKEIYSQDNSVGLSLFSEKRPYMAPARFTSREQKAGFQRKEKRDIFCEALSRYIYLTICLAGNLLRELQALVTAGPRVWIRHLSPNAILFSPNCISSVAENTPCLEY